MWGYFGKLTADTGRYLFYFIWYGFHLCWYRLVLFFSRYRLYLSRRFQFDGRSSFISIIIKFLIYINSSVPMQLREKHVAQHPCKLSFHPLFMYFVSSKWRDNQLFSPVNMVGVPQRGRVACFIKVSVCARMYLSIQTFNRSREKKLALRVNMEVFYWPFFWLSCWPITNFFFWVGQRLTITDTATKASWYHGTRLWSMHGFSNSWIENEMDRERWTPRS